MTLFERNLDVKTNKTLILELFSLVPRTLTPEEEKILEDAMEKSAHINSHAEWQRFVARLIETHNVKVMAMFWKFFDEFGVITDDHVKDVLIHALRAGIKNILQRHPSKIEDMDDPALLKYYKEMLPDYEKALKLQ